MTSYRPPTPDPPGYWGDLTSSLYWCEEKYKWSHYIAEPANTFSNLFFILVSLYGVYRTTQQNLPTRFVLAHAGVAFVGVGSTAFHATLKREMQLLDELPMIYTSALLCYAVLETSPGYSKTPQGAVLLPTFFLALVAGITAAYLASGNAVLHQIAFAAILLCSTSREWWLLHHPSSPLVSPSGGGKFSVTTAASSSSSSSQTPPPSNDIQSPPPKPNTNESKRQEIASLNLKGALIFLTGFAIWNLDNLFCAQLRAARAVVGYPLAWGLEGHAWWHLFTGYGAYCLNVAATQLVVSVKEQPENVRLIRGFLPYIERVRPYPPTQPSGKLTNNTRGE